MPTPNVPEGSVTVASAVEPVAPTQSPTPVQDKFIQFGGRDTDGSEKVIFSTTGERRTIDEFEKAFSSYLKTRQVPSGFSILDPDSITAKFRGGYEAVNQPIQNASEAVITSRYNPVNSLPSALSTPINFLLRQPAEAVKTPEALGANIGIAAIAPWLKPASTLAGATGEAVLNKSAPLINAIATGLASATGYGLMGVATGNYDVGKTGLQLALGSMSGGATTLIGDFINKFIKPDLREKVATDILGTIANKYPALKSNPTYLDAYLSSPQKVAELTQQMSKAVRGNLDDTTSSLVTDITNVVPKSFTVGEQATLRKYARDFSSYANDMLDNLDNPAALNTAKEGMKEVSDKLKSFVVSVMKSGKVAQGVNISYKQGFINDTTNRMIGVLNRHAVELNNYMEGIEVLSALKRSGAHEGFNPQRFYQTIVGQDQQTPGSLMSQVGRKLGMGSSLTEQTQPPNVGDMARSVYNMLTGHLPIPQAWKTAMRMAKPEGSNLLTWQTQKGLSSGQNMAVQIAGQDAVRDFLNKTKR